MTDRGRHSSTDSDSDHPPASQHGDRHRESGNWAGLRQGSSSNASSRGLSGGKLSSASSLTLFALSNCTAQQSNAGGRSETLHMHTWCDPASPCTLNSSTHPALIRREDAPHRLETVGITALLATHPMRPSPGLGGGCSLDGLLDNPGADHVFLASAWQVEVASDPRMLQPIAMILFPLSDVLHQTSPPDLLIHLCSIPSVAPGVTQPMSAGQQSLVRSPKVVKKTRQGSVAAGYGHDGDLRPLSRLGSLLPQREHILPVSALLENLRGGSAKTLQHRYA